MKALNIFVFLAMLAGNALAQTSGATASLRVKPSKCVALHKGQKCYQGIELQWRSTANGNYCIFRRGRKTALKCWKKLQNGSLNYDFAFSESQQFELREKHSNQVIATAEVKYASVYKRKKKSFSGWRLF